VAVELPPESDDTSPARDDDALFCECWDEEPCDEIAGEEASEAPVSAEEEVAVVAADDEEGDEGEEAEVVNGDEAGTLDEEEGMRDENADAGGGGGGGDGTEDAESRCQRRSSRR